MNNILLKSAVALYRDCSNKLDFMTLDSMHLCKWVCLHLSFRFYSPSFFPYSLISRPNHLIWSISCYVLLSLMHPRWHCIHIISVFSLSATLQHNVSLLPLFGFSANSSTTSVLHSSFLHFFSGFVLSQTANFPDLWTSLCRFTCAGASSLPLFFHSLLLHSFCQLHSPIPSILIPLCCCCCCCCCSLNLQASSPICNKLYVCPLASKSK